ncbi:hypothetical protein [Microbacterium flavum]|uniref:hypothetical protein n=1 Tax=Microbacterium flavum TaxID=415216 RepID=UPI0024ADE2C1|nr:hypothetical protein [Microbacterium flavum]
MTTIAHHSLRLWAAAVVVASALVLALGIAPAHAAPAVESTTVDTGIQIDAGIQKAADLGSFRPGNIISDAVFFNSMSMSEAQIQAFLESKVSECRRGYTCLKDKYDTTRSIPQDAMCGAYAGGGSERASRIIFKVAQACGINPQVLLVTLQKEQGLVTDTWPTAGQYRASMGQGCPDTAACDSTYYGFFNQMQGAAWQFKRYANPPGTSRFFTWYAPGKTWNVRFHPNEACGTSPVYIENQATANLYYYTPYQPNGAAIRAGYGLGDGCSSYGNRNFYNYFVDWFGSTQSSYGPIVTGPARDRVYLVNGGVKYPVATSTDLTALGAGLGGLQVVPSAYLDSLPTGRTMSRYVHDARSGTLYLLELDGTKHRFTSGDQIAMFGYAFSSYVNLEPGLVDAFATGEEVGTFSRSSGGKGEVYYLENGLLRYVYDTPAYAFAARDKSSYIATMDAGAFKRIPRGPTFFAPNTLVRATTSGDVYMTTPTSTVIHIPSFALAAEYGATSYKVVPDATMAKSVAKNGMLTPVVMCGDDQYIAAGGALRPLSGSTGLATIRLSPAECAAFPRGGAVSTPVFVQPAGAPEIYVISAGKLQHVRTPGQLSALNGGRPLVILPWQKATVDAVGLTAPALESGAFVQFDGQPEVYWNSADSLRHVADFGSLVALGGGRVPTISRLPASFAKAYTYGDEIGDVPLLAENSFAQITGGDEVYRFVEGELHHITDYATLTYLGGGRVPSIAIVPRAAAPAFPTGTPIAARTPQPDGAFVQFAGYAQVYLVSGGKLRHVQRVETLIALGGGRIPSIRQLASEERLAWLLGAPA